MNTGAPLFGTINPTLFVVRTIRASISFPDAIHSFDIGQAHYSQLDRDLELWLETALAQRGYLPSYLGDAERRM
jgi:hypothetical protein